MFLYYFEDNGNAIMHIMKWIMTHIQCKNLLNKLIHLSNKINQLFLINKTSLWFMVR